MSLGGQMLSQGYLKRIPRDRKIDAFPYELRIAIDLQCVTRGWVVTETECAPEKMDITE